MKIIDKHQIEQVKLQNQAAFDDLFQTYYPMALKKAITITHNLADAEDVVQETFLQIYHSISTLNDSSCFISWLYKIIHSKSINLFYKNRHRYLVEPIYLEKYCDYEETRRYMLPKQSLELTCKQEQINHHIQLLKPQEQDIIQLTFLQELKLEEAAQLLNIPLGTVKTRRSKAKKHLKHTIMKDSNHIQSFY